MNRPNYYKAMFYVAAAFNWIMAAAVISGANVALGIPLPLDALGKELLCLFIAVFGYGYYLIGRDITRNEGIVVLGIVGKVLFFGLLAGNAIAGRMPIRVLIPASGDLVFVILFFEFLLNGRISSR
jgi:hypothetical protein